MTSLSTSPDFSGTISEAELTKLLPTCQRCRRLRRKCDTDLPACRLCQKGKAECTFYDHALQQTLPRSYVHSLLNRLARLRAVQQAISHDVIEPVTSNTSLPHEFNHVRTFSTATVESHLEPDWPARTNTISFDKHFVLEDANPTCWQYFGSSSGYSLAVEVLVAASARFGKLTHPENYAGPEFKLNMAVPETLDRQRVRDCPPREEVEMLVRAYSGSTNVINGYSDETTINAEIDTYMRNQGEHIKSLKGLEAHQFFRTAMICAIQSANKSRHQSRYEDEAFQYYVEAIQCAEEVTSDVSLDSLQALLLLTLYTFSYPRRGDVWKILDYACRLIVELNIHCETNDEYEDEKSRQRRRSIFWGLYSLERTFGQHTGRPSDLPEEIITAEYPAPLQPPPLDAKYTQYMLVSHYYRLIYLRSEIFRVLYMPANAPSLPRQWFEERFDDLNAWRGEVAHIIEDPMQEQGIGTLQIEMSYNTSITYLFQPLLLRALAAIKDPQAVHNPSGASDLLIPLESYEAAVRSIDFYTRVFHGEESTPEGEYPVTIVSAHYIQQATLTVMAHVLLAIDGRLPLVSFDRHLTVDTFQRTVDQDGNVHVDVPPIDFSHIGQISDACLVLLRRIADRWTGMVGMFDIYKEMHDKVLPSLESRYA